MANSILLGGRCHAVALVAGLALLGAAGSAGGADFPPLGPLPPVPEPLDNPTTPAKVELGKKLF